MRRAVLPLSRIVGARNQHRDWLRVGVCSACGTWVLVDDEFERSDHAVFHTECLQARS